MKLLSDKEASAWVRDAGAEVRGELPLVKLSLSEPSAKVRITVPQAPNAVIGLAYTLVVTGIPDFWEEDFASGLVWLQRWEIWSESIDQVGYTFLNGLRGASSDTLAAKPAHLFGATEFVHAHACLAIPLLMQWDAYYLSANAEYLSIISHEGYVDLVARGAGADAGALVERLKSQSLAVEMMAG